MILSIHPPIFCSRFYLHSSSWGFTRAYPSCHWVIVGCTLDWHFRATEKDKQPFTVTPTTNLKFQSFLMGMFCVGKTRLTGRTWKLHTERPQVQESCGALRSQNKPQHQFSANMNMSWLDLCRTRVGMLHLWLQLPPLNIHWRSHETI